jgi:hypothetical protein
MPRLARLRFAIVPAASHPPSLPQAAKQPVSPGVLSRMVSMASSFMGTLIDPRASVRYATVARSAATNGQRPTVMVVFEDQLLGTLVAPRSKEEVRV